MTTLQASRLKGILDRAKKAGHSEEAATIADVPLVFSSLPTPVYAQIMQELEELPEVDYVLNYQIEHVCHSIVEIDGQDFRDVDYIEVEDTDDDGNPIKVERHQWVRDNLVQTWSREMLLTAYHKVMDAISAAEERSKEGVTFRIESESDEDRYHRLLAELKSAGEELPSDLRTAILQEHGLLEATSKEELEALNEEAKQWVLEQHQKAEAETASQQLPSQESTLHQESTPVEEEPPRAPTQLVQAYHEAEEEPQPTLEEESAPVEEESTPVEEEPAPVEEDPTPHPAQPVVPAQPVARPRTPREMLEASQKLPRQPLNRTPIAPPVPPASPHGAATGTVNPKSGKPTAAQMAPTKVNPTAARYAAMEQAAVEQGGVALDANGKPAGAVNLTGPSPVIEEKVSTKIDKQGIRYERPLEGGRNPKYDPRRNQGMGGINPRDRGGR